MVDRGRVQRVSPLTTWFAAVTMVAIAMWAGAGEASGAVALNVTEAIDGTYQVEGRFRVRASVEEVWRVLTDYPGIARFSSSVARSEVRAHGEHHALVAQEAVVSFMLIKRRMRVILDVREEPHRVIRFSDTLLEDFKRYQGAWVLHAEPGAVLVLYELRALPNSPLPGFIERRLVGRDLEKLLVEVRTEIERVAAEWRPG